MAGTDFSHLTTDELIKGIKALDLPNYIRSKAYGVDVRETLAQITEMLMQLAYNQGMTPQQAQDWVSQLNNKIIKGQVTMNDLTQEVKEALTGGSVAVVGVGAVGTVNLQNNAVTPEVTSFLETGANLFNPDTASKGYTTNWQGDVTPSSYHTLSDFISVIPTESYTGDVVYNVTWYDTSKNFLSRDNFSGGNEVGPVFTAPENAFYMRVVVSISNSTVQVNKGSVLLSYEPYKLMMKNFSMPNEFKDDLIFKSSTGLYYSNGKELIDFSYSDRTVYIPDGYFVYGKLYVRPTNDETEKTPYRYEVPFSPVTSSGLQALYFDKSSNKFVCKHYSEINNVPSGHYLVATFSTTDNGTPPVSAMRVKVNGEVVGKNEELEPETVSFDKNKQRFLLPSKMFFVEGDTLPLYKSSFFVGNTDINTNTTKTALMTLNAKQEPTIEYFYENITLDPIELNERFEIMMKGNRSNSEFYTSMIEKVSTSMAEKEGRTPTILNIGDSLTQNSIPTFLKEKLEEYGVNPTMVGTRTDVGGTKGEGRAGWEFDNFIGKDNTNWSAVITPAPTSGYVGAINQNPFLKLATVSDKEKYPEWCFRSTGSSNELSYAEDMDKTGDFYVFDFSHYLQTYGIDTPDIITIALSTNDITQETSENAVADSRLSLEVMVKRIKEVLPNVKIGVVPVSAYHISNSKWDTTIATWIEHAMNDVKTYSLEYSDLDVIPAWAHMNREFVFPATYSDLSPINNEQVGIVTDRIHYEIPGRREQAKVIAAYVMNVC